MITGAPRRACRSPLGEVRALALSLSTGDGSHAEPRCRSPLGEVRALALSLATGDGSHAEPRL